MYTFLLGLYLGVKQKLCTSDWDLNPQGQDLNPAKTHSLPTEVTHLVSGLNKAQVLFLFFFFLNYMYVWYDVNCFFVCLFVFIY